MLTLRPGKDLQFCFKNLEFAGKDFEKIVDSWIKNAFNIFRLTDIILGNVFFGRNFPNFDLEKAWNLLMPEWWKLCY